MINHSKRVGKDSTTGGGGGGDVTLQYEAFLTLCVWVLHGKNGLQTTFVPPPNHQIVREHLRVGCFKLDCRAYATEIMRRNVILN